MAHLPMRREALATLKTPRRNAQGIEVLEQMFAYFNYDDMPYVQQDESSDYERAAA